LVALLVCLIPTTIGALLAAIGIAGMDRALQANVLAKSGKAVETAGDIDPVLLDKTGTITIGNRHAPEDVPVGELTALEVRELAAAGSVADETPEGKSIVRLFLKQAAAVTKGPVDLASLPSDAEAVPFSAQTRMSGVNLPDGQRLRKGAPDAVIALVQQAGGTVPAGIGDPPPGRAAGGAAPPPLAPGGRRAGRGRGRDPTKER